MSLTHQVVRVPGATNVGYFMPAQVPPAGTALTKQSGDHAVPELFKPITIRGTTFSNRVWVCIDDSLE